MLDGLVIVTLDGRVLKFNKNYKEMLGYEDSELPELTYQQLTPEKWHKTEAEIIKNEVLAYGASRVYQKEYIKKDGTIFPVELRAFLTQDEQDKKVILGIVRDITQQKEYEQKLLSNEKRYKALFEQSNDGILLIENKIITDANKMIEKLFESKNEDIIGSYLSQFVKKFSPQNQTDTHSSLPQAEKFIELAQKGESQTFEWKHITSTNKPFYAQITIFKIEIENSHPILQIIIRDITKFKKAQQQLNQKQKMEAIGQLAGGLAHDFNNMLSSIIGSLELLQMDTDWSGKKQEYIDIIKASTERATGLTSKLLHFSRKESHDSEKMDLLTAIRESILILKHTIDKKINIIFKIKEENNSAIIEGNISQIMNSILNLGINASHAMPNGGNLKIICQSAILDEFFCKASPFKINPGKYYKLTVEDTGEGISKENLKRIFEPFFTTKETGKGTGLGLASVYATVMQHHGALSVYSELQHGTSFNLFFPACADTQLQVSQKIRLATKGTGNILLIEDEPFLREITQKSLNFLGYDVDTTENGVEGLKAFKNSPQKYDLVILDMIMPKMNGKECFHELKKIEPNLKIILASGFYLDNELEDLKKLGLSGFIKKPFQVAELSELIANTLKEK